MTCPGPQRRCSSVSRYVYQFAGWIWKMEHPKMKWALLVVRRYILQCDCILCEFEIMRISSLLLHVFRWENLSWIMRGLQERIPRIKCDRIVSSDCKTAKSLKLKTKLAPFKIIVTGVGNRVEIRFCRQGSTDICWRGLQLLVCVIDECCRISFVSSTCPLPSIRLHSPPQAKLCKRLQISTLHSRSCWNCP
jgi:hypothetical protein